MNDESRPSAFVLSWRTSRCDGESGAVNQRPATPGPYLLVSRLIKDVDTRGIKSKRDVPSELLMCGT